MQTRNLIHPNNYIVYKHTSPSGKVYIGITCQNVCKRWKNGKGYELCTAFYRAILKYGWDNIQHEILYTGLTKIEACARERLLIAKYLSNDPRYGYNLTSGGEHYEQGEEATLRLSESLKKYYFEHPEARIKISEGQKGRKASSETKEKMSKARKAYLEAHPEKRMECGNSKRGTHLSLEARQKLREINQKRVICVETGEIFESIKAAALFAGVRNTAISNNLAGRSQRCNGYHFVYA